MKLQLKVLWLEKFLGFAINQTVSQKSYSVTSYYFWPRTEVWDQLKLELDSKSWVTNAEKIKVLNQITEIMNYWKQTRTVKNLESLKTQFAGIEFVTLQE